MPRAPPTRHCARGKRRPLLGIPMTIKESYNIAGTPTTWGFPQQKDFVPSEDALSITRVKDAGGVSSARPTFRSGSATGRATTRSTVSPTTPTTPAARRAVRPADRQRRSPRATAAVARLRHRRLLRVPAFHCGVYAHKPTFSWSSRGHTPPPLPRSVRARPCRGRPDGALAADLSLLLDVIAGPMSSNRRRPTGSSCRLRAIPP